MAPDAATLVRQDAPPSRQPRALATPPPPPSPPRAAPGPLSRNWALVLGLGWPTIIAIATAIEPAPANPDAPVPPLAAALGLIFAAALVVTVGAAAARRARAPMWSTMLGVLALGLVVACPVSGHHNFGAWWFGELALYGGMLAASLAALRAQGPPPAKP